ncbi:hypothetical protein [Poseidonibacter lekithochrous]|uniref:hypothetical protein n=1 Tax=Poseidonibacter lekithochrous TaxID=1904463 RepID=UPI0008FC2BB5|nr:hypothetical protein [Poseidonibacter lekithochrous]QKJ22746.1 hypothetical protein ALEK_1475 [Poseidonibacter lekithochrous]
MKKLLYIMFSAVLVLFAYPLLAEEQDEISTFSNEAQVAKAETLSEISQEKAQEEALETQANIEAAEESLANAQDNLATLEQDPNASLDEINAANLAVEEAFAELDRETKNLADISSVSVEEIAQMREDGLGWGDISHELGIHPSNLGLGHGKKDARERSSKSFDKDNSYTSNSNKGNAFGLVGKASSNKGNKGGGISNSSRGNSFRGKGNGQGNNGNGNAGGNGNGNGNGGGNGNGKN